MRRMLLGNTVVIRSIAVSAILAALLVTGCSAQKSQLAEQGARDSGNAWLLPKGFTPLRGLDPDNAAHYPDGWPRFIVSERDNMVMVYVEGGVFEMGTPPKSRRVYVDPFYMDSHEVTNSQFDRFRKDERHDTADRRGWNRPWMESNAFHTYPNEYGLRIDSKQQMYPEVAYNFGFWKGQNPDDIDFYLDYWVPGHNNDDPVRNVSWWEAWLYTQWSEKLLPTEAQWEFAARGRLDTRNYPWGDDTALAGSRCNSGDDAIHDGVEYVASAMTYASGISPYGCYNMAGNVWEWCMDNYDPHFGSRPRKYPWVDPHPYEPHQHPGGYMDLQRDCEVNPIGPLHGDERAIRGGSYTESLDQCSVATRRGARPDVHQMNIGFRCVLPIPAEAPMAAANERSTIHIREETRMSEPEPVVE